MAGLAFSSGVWLVVSTLLALFAGGWMAARLSGAERGSSVLHGAVTWGLSSLATVYLITFATGSVLSGAAGIIGKTASTAGQGASALAPEIAKAIGAQAGEGGIGWAEVKKEASDLLQKNPEGAAEQISALWTQIEARGNNTITAADQEAIANILVAHTDLTKPEAMKMVTKSNKAITDGAQKFAEVKANAESKARELADTTATTVANAATWSFFGLIVGLLAALGGGYLGSPTLNKIAARKERSGDPLIVAVPA